MPNDWAEGIVVADLNDEPELAEEFAAIFDRLKSVPTEKLPHLVLNFSAVTYLNSSHIAGMLRMRKRLVEGRKQFVLCGLSDDVWSVLLLTGLDKVFQVAPDPMTALARVQLSGADQG